jgi:hypothetical protein
VIAQGDNCISVNWSVTFKESVVKSKALAREYERYMITEYFMQHPFKPIRWIAKKIYDALPDYVQVTWKHEEMIKTPYSINGLTIITHILKELSLMGRVLIHYPKVRAYLKNIGKMNPIKKIA